MLPFAIDHNLKGTPPFQSWVECGTEGEYAHTQFLADLPDLISKIEDEEAAIGYTVYSDQISDVKWLSVVDNLGVNYDLNKETILRSRYPLATVYYMYLNIPAHRKGFTGEILCGAYSVWRASSCIEPIRFHQFTMKLFNVTKDWLSLEEPASLVKSYK